MFAYCGNNPVNRVDPNGEGWIGVAVLLVLGAFLLGAMTSCSSNNADSVNADSVTEVNHTIDYGSEYIKVSVDVTNIPESDDFLIDYTNALAKEIEESEDGIIFLGKSKIDKAKLYAEIKFHAVSWDNHFMRGHANPAEINIYSDGSVKDPRPWLDKLMFDLYGGEYE